MGTTPHTLITGASGLVGSAVARKLVAAGFRVRALVRSTSTRAHLDGLDLEYAFGDIPALARAIDAVLAYYRTNPDRFTPPANFAQAYAGVRDGLTAMRAQILTDADKIRATRQSKGLENRN